MLMSISLTRARFVSRQSKLFFLHFVTSGEERSELRKRQSKELLSFKRLRKRNGKLKTSDTLTRKKPRNLRRKKTRRKRNIDFRKELSWKREESKRRLLDNCARENRKRRKSANGKLSKGNRS